MIKINNLFSKGKSFLKLARTLRQYFMQGNPFYIATTNRGSERRKYLWCYIGHIRWSRSMWINWYFYVVTTLLSKNIKKNRPSKLPTFGEIIPHFSSVTASRPHFWNTSSFPHFLKYDTVFLYEAYFSSKLIILS